MFLKLLFHWMLKSLLVWTKSLPEYCRAVPRPWLSHSSICSPIHYAMLLYLSIPVGKSTKLCLSLKLVIHTQSRTITPFHCYPIHQKSLNGLPITKFSPTLVKPFIHISLVSLKIVLYILQQILTFLDQIINSPLQTGVIYFNISKAFDTVFHSILLNKLWSVGIAGAGIMKLVQGLAICQIVTNKESLLITLIYCL